MRTSDYKLAARRALYIAAVADAIALVALAGGSHEISPVALILAAPVFLVFDLTRDLAGHWYWDSWMFWPISALLVFPVGLALCIPCMLTLAPYQRHAWHLTPQSRGTRQKRRAPHCER